MSSITHYKTKAGRRWQVQWTRPDGRRTRKRGFPTKAEAQAWIEDQGVSRRSGTWIDPVHARITVESIGNRWLAAQTHLKPSSLHATTSTWNTHVKPKWGHRQIGSILHSEIQEWVSTMDRSASTVRKAHACLAQILDAAIADNKLQTNPARGVKLPKKRRSVKVYLTMEQVKTLADECSKNQTILWTLAVVGLRWSELAGLKIHDLDLTARRAHLKRAAVTVGSSVEVGSLKTDEERTVVIPTFVCNMLVPIIEGRSSGEYVWCRPNGEPLLLPSHGSWFHEALKRVRSHDPEFPTLTIHGLRHVAAGLLVSSGAHVKVVQHQLGHSSAAMTLDIYADLFPEDLDVVANALDLAHLKLVEPKMSQNALCS